MTYLYKRLQSILSDNLNKVIAQDTMLPSPSSSPVFAPRTNTLHTLPLKQTDYLPTPPSDNKLKKRQLFHDTIKPQKRLKLDLNDVGESDSDEGEDVYMEPQETARLRARQSTRSYNIFSQFTTNPVMRFSRPASTSCYSLILRH